MTATDRTELWVQSEALLDGGYGVAVSVGQDRAWILNRDQAIAYAVTCFARATAAEHDCAAYTLLKCLGVAPAEAARTITHDVRPARTQDDTATAPLSFVCAVNDADQPFVLVSLDGTATGQMSPDALRVHGSVVLSVLAAADLDTNFRQVLTDQVQVAEHTARHLVSALQQHWPGREHR